MSKQLWFGRMWQLRSLLNKYYKATSMGSRENRALRDKGKLLEEQFRRDPKLKDLLKRIQAQWRGALFRRISRFAVFERIEDDIHGVLVFMHGSGGMTGNNLRFARIFAGLGFLVIAPDDMASSKYRKRLLQPLPTFESNTDYWENDLVYASATSGEFAYNTQVDAVLKDPSGYKKLYEKVYQERRSELHYVLSHLPDFVDKMGVFTMGTSEGAMTVARFDDQRYGTMIDGRIISAFCVEYCYFTPTHKAAEFGGNLSVPTLNIIGSHDEYFGTNESIAQKVASDKERGYGSTQLQGHAFQTMIRQGMEHGCVCVFDKGLHDLTTTADNILRDIFSTFSSRPHRIHELNRIWSRDKTLMDQIVVLDEQQSTNHSGGILLLRVRKSPYPQTISQERQHALHLLSGKGQLFDMAKGMQAQVRREKEQSSVAKRLVQSAPKKPQASSRSRHVEGFSTKRSAKHSR